MHHGNGTQWSFFADPSVLFISSHQFPYYPGTGAANEIGTGAGEFIELVGIKCQGAPLCIRHQLSQQNFARLVIAPGPGQDSGHEDR